MVGYVYILESQKNNTFYIGITCNLARRLLEHQTGHSKYTREILPIILVFSQKYPSLKIARKTESWLKRLKDKRIISRIISEGRINKVIN